MTKQKYLFILSFVSCLSFSEEHALDLYSMKKFCSDKMVKLMTPSQKRQGSFVYALTFFSPCSCCFSPWSILRCWCCYCCRSLSILSWVKDTHRDTHERKSPYVIWTSWYYSNFLFLWNNFILHFGISFFTSYWKTPPVTPHARAKSFHFFPWCLVHYHFPSLMFSHLYWL